MKNLAFTALIILSAFLSACSDISLMTRGDDSFNKGDYKAAIQSYEKVVEMTSDRTSPYFGLPTGEEARKKIDVSNLALTTKDEFAKGNDEFWHGHFSDASEHYKNIDPQFLSEDEKKTYEKNRPEILKFLAQGQGQAPVVQSPAPVHEEPAQQVKAPPATAQKVQEELSAHPDPNASSYFPLNPGWKYFYRSSIPIGGKTIYQSLQEEVLAEETIRDQKVIPIKTSQTGQSPNTLYYEIQGDQVLVVAERKSNQGQPVFYEFPLIEIKGPVAEGSSWVYQGKPRVVVGLESIDAVSERFANCLKIVEQSDLMKTTRWYAPGVGLVKREQITFPGKSYESHFETELTKLEK